MQCSRLEPASLAPNHRRSAGGQPGLPYGVEGRINFAKGAWRILGMARYGSEFWWLAYSGSTMGKTPGETDGV